ncbi:glycosyltransferase family 4 protein [Vibrio europaeus]|uniref:glycosyltransferase family 4 protein n=1 Tax=Vibrio europaeus TaxID=300876 RepID=UPI002341F6D8|nr:glycosyltransferase family 4 protein [Vibrio europaeus]MDC5852102.1 glycosyltransferase family 4 protein [Vibrio europaeus]
MKVTYFINQYPMVSHSFIRREIMALERQGIEVQRISIRGWDVDTVNEDDSVEKMKTKYVLDKGVLPLLKSTVKNFISNPSSFWDALKLTFKVSRTSDRSLALHLISLAEACHILPWLKEFCSEHVHVHFGTNSTEVVMLANALGGPTYSFTVHGPEEFDKPQAIKLQEKVNRSKFVVGISSYGRSQLFRWIDKEQWSKVKVVHCGLEKSFHRVDPVPLPEQPKLVCVGRLCEQKGQLLLMEACKRLAEDNVDFELILAGDGELRSEIETLISRYNLSDKVAITGWIGSDEVRELILASKGMILPSFAEGLPVVIMEAMSLRRPALTTYVAGIPELVEKGENGWIFPAGDVDEIYLSMKDILETPNDSLSIMAESAYQRVTQRHDIDTEASKLVKLFKS